MKGEIIAVGTELLLGQIENTNTSYLCQELAALGINVYYTGAVGDNAGRLRSCLEIAWNRSELLILTGGLGPTMDDITRETVGEFLGLELKLDREVLTGLQEFFARRGRHMTENNVKQAFFPEGATVLPNGNGTAAGMLLEKDGRIVLLLPGPPFEMKPMFREQVVPYLEKRLVWHREVITSRVLKLYGIGESQLESILYPLIVNQTNPTLAPLAKETEVHLRLTAKAGSLESARESLGEMEERIRSLVGKHIFAVDEETMEEVVGILLRQGKKDISIAESCTGGLIGHRLTEIPGSSQYFYGGVISYSNQAKEKTLRVNPQLLRFHGAVSPEVAEAMALGIREKGQTDLGLAVTGIAGPGGGKPDKPVGLVYMALADSTGTHVEKHLFAGPRQVIKRRASQAALDLVRRYLQGYLEKEGE